MPKIILLTDLAEEYGRGLIKGIMAYAKEHGPWVFCRMPEAFKDAHGIKDFCKWAKDWGADGIIGRIRTEDDAEQIKRADIPLIAQDFKERLSNAVNITGAYHDTGKMAAEYFLKNGYTNFAFYGFKNIVWSRERAEGYEATVKKHGYKVHYFEQRRSNTSELWYYKPSPLSEWLTSLPKPMALMACDDNLGQQITEACKLTGIRIPEELAVLGVDNDEMICTISNPALSSISLDVVKGGYDAAALMDKMIKQKRKLQWNDIIVKPMQIVTRQSTDIYAANDPYILPALKYIHENIHQNLRVTHVLKHIPLSRRALETRFQKVTGFPLYRYIYHLRIEKFSRLLLETDKSIFEIATETGFDSSKNLSRLFKEVKGCTPGEYRKKHLIK
jgi:LacI family transcriptional regulator